MHSDLLLLQASSLSSSNHHLIPALGSGKEELTLQSPYFTHQFLPFLKLWFQPKSATEFLLLKDPNNHLNLKSNSVFSDIFSLTVKQQKTVSFFHGLSLPNVRPSRFSWFANCSSRLFHINTLAQKFLTLELVLLTITNSSTSTLHHRCSFIRLSFCCPPSFSPLNTWNTLSDSLLHSYLYSHCFSLARSYTFCGCKVTILLKSPGIQPNALHVMNACWMPNEFIFKITCDQSHIFPSHFLC